MKMECWMEYSNRDGLILFEPCWLPEGQKPESDEANFERVPAFDWERAEDASTKMTINLKRKGYHERLEEYEKFDLANKKT